MTKAKLGDTIYITKRAKTVGAVVKAVVTAAPGWCDRTATATGYHSERFLRPNDFEATEQAARDKAEQIIAKEIAALERRLTKLRGFAGNIKVIDRT